MQNNIHLINGIELSRRDKERQGQRLLSYRRRYTEKKAVKAQAGK